MGSVSAGVQAENPQLYRSYISHLRKRNILLGVALFFATIAVYLPVHTHPFFNVDDGLYVTHNEHVQDGLRWRTVTWAFTSFDRSNWVPVSFLSHALDYQMFGENPAGHHDVNMLFQALNAVLLFWVLAAATGSTWTSFTVAALFALHPLNVEAVAWIAERKTVLSMFFFLLTLGAYRWYAREPKVGRYLTVALLFALGLCAKAQIITLPCVLLLWDYWPLRRMFPSGEDSAPPSAPYVIPAKKLSWLVLEKLPLLALCAIDALFTIHSEHEARTQLWPPLTERLGNAIYSYSRYIQKAFWPSALAPFYPNRGNTLTVWQIAAALIFLLAVTGLVLAYRRHRYLPVGWFWFLGTLVPMLEIVQFGKEGMADRFAYQALIGLFIMGCFGIAEWAEARQVSPKWLTAAGFAVLLALSLTTRHQVNTWKDDMTLWQHATAVVPGHWQAEDNIGVALLHQGNPESVVMPHFVKAAEIHPSDPLSNMHLALYAQKNGKLREAIGHYEKVLLTPTPPQIEASIEQSMGLLYTQLGDAAKAKECFDKAVSLRTK